MGNGAAAFNLGSKFSQRNSFRRALLVLCSLCIVAILSLNSFSSGLAQDESTTTTTAEPSATEGAIQAETVSPTPTLSLTTDFTATPDSADVIDSATQTLEALATETETETPSESPTFPNSETPTSTLTETPIITATADCTTLGAEYVDICAAVNEQGSVRVIIELNVSTQSLGGLSTSQQAAQQSRILSSQRQVLNQLSTTGVGKVREYSFIPFMAMEIDEAALGTLASVPEVANIYPDFTLAPTLDFSVPHIGAPTAWSFGFTGAGQTIAILDTGVQSSHPFLSGKIVSQACYSSDTNKSVSFCPGTWGTTAVGSGLNCGPSVEGCDHGTHVAGIAAGSGPSFDGVAPDADIISIQVFSRFEGEADCGGIHQFCALAWFSDVLAGLQRVYFLRNTHSIAVANLSLGAGIYSSFCNNVYPAMNVAINNLRSVGIATVISAGNGSNSNGLSFPACISNAISVGATDDGDEVAGFSNSDTMLSLLAPGSGILSSVPSGGYESMSGTSMAAPHVAGAWALLKDVNPNLTVAQALSILQGTGRVITDARNNVIRSLIQVDGAAILASPKPLAPGQLSPVANAIINSTSPTFTWGASLNSERYTLSIWTDPSDPHTGEQTFNGGPGELSYTASPLSEGVHYWRVAGINEYGNLGTYTPFTKLTIDLTPPLTPSLSQPSDSSLLTTTAPKLQWLAPATAAQYQLQIATDSGFSSIVLNQNVTTLFHQLTSAQALDFVPHFWRVRAIDAAGNPSSWSVVRSFDVNLLSSPVAGGFTTDTTPLFTWISGLGATEYRVRLDNDSDFSSPITDETTNVLMLQSDDLDAGIYYWQLSAHNVWGWSSWSPSRSFTLSSPPVAPVLNSPANLTFINDSTPSFGWSASPEGDTYEIWIDTTNTFISPRVLEFTGGSGGLDYTVTTPLANGIYHWRVRAKNSLGFLGAWSASRQLTVDTVAPTTPSIVKPANNFVSNGPTVHQWSKPIGAVLFDIEYDNSIAFDTVDYSAQTAANSFAPPAVQQLSGPYFWHVRARDAAGNVSAWTAPRQLTINVPSLSKVVLSLPTNNSLSSNASHNFTWQALPYALTYDIHISTVASFSNLVNSQAGLTALTHIMSGMPDGKYYWRVRGMNSGGPGTWSTTFTFTQDTQGPLAPTNAKPTNAAIVTGTPFFQWVRPTGATRFEVQLDELLEGDFDTPVYENATIAAVSFKTPLNLLGNYVWRVRARDAAGNWGPYAGPFSLTVLAPLPAKPTLAVPVNNAFINSTFPTLAWGSVAYAETYLMQISQVSNFSTVLEQGDDLPTPGYAVLTSLAEGKYYWRVRAENVSGANGPFSETFIFTVDLQPPGAPIPSQPGGNATTAGTPTFTWNKPTGAVQFRLLIDEDGGDFTASPDFDSGWISATSLKPAFALFSGIGDFDWQVCSRDVAGNSGLCSPVRNLHINPPVTAAPSLSLLSANAITTDNTPNFAWLSVPYGATYEIQIDNNSNFNSPERTNTSSVLNFSPSLLMNGKFYWRVRALNVNGVPGGWSAARSFTIIP